MAVNALLGQLLSRTITVAAVLTAMWFAWNGVYAFAAAFVLLLVVYVYIAWYGDEPIEERLI
ncbi:hypothetical protein BRD01_04920 [Halobacteriales archaeon QS_8_65_32]|jgi:Ca2+/Na+ antiporter|nr:MAG: hypothetical protein BRD01_04920 [Halobacteriales archaeon QS_8_65_32]